MKRNELRIRTNGIGEYIVSLWVVKPHPYTDYLVSGACGKTKLKAIWALIKWMYKYDSLKYLLYIRSIKYV